jgi:hypothetical protein
MLALLLLGCNPWDFPESEGYNYRDGALWDPEVVVATDGTYVRLPSAGRLVRVTPDGTFTTIDLDGGEPQQLLAAPNGDGLFVRVSWPVCDDTDPEIVYVDECPDSKLGMQSEMVLVRGGKRVGGGALDEVSPVLDKAFWTDSSGLVALTVDPASASTVSVDGFLNLNEVTFVDMAGGETHRVSVGFAADSVLFSADESRAVVLSRSEVAVVNLAEGSDSCDAWSVCVTYPLTLDADQVLYPEDVALVADGRYALVSVRGSADLYVLDLEREAIDLIELSGVPSVLVDDPENGRTMVGYARSAVIDVIDHEYFEISTVPVDEPCTDGALTPAGALFYYRSGNAYKDVITVDSATGDWREQRAENPLVDLWAGTRFAVATMSPDNNGSGTVYDVNYGLGIFPLAAPSSTAKADSVSLVLQSEPVGVVTTESDEGDYAFLLMRDVDTLLRVRLADAAATQLPLEAPALALFPAPDGSLVVAADSPMGMLAFVDPGSDEPVSVAGFALAGFAERPVLPRRAAVE